MLRKILNKNDIKELLDIVKDPSIKITENIPLIVRPIVSFIIYIFTILFLLVLLPIIIPLVILFGRKENSFSKLYKELEIKWYTESKLNALKKLREIYSILNKDFDKLSRMKSIQIDPYGKFRWSEYFQVIESLYLWEFRNKNYEEAGKICNDILKKILNNKTKIDNNTERFIVYNAKVINILKGNIAAQKYLMEYLNPKKKESPIKEYLYELRKKK